MGLSHIKPRGELVFYTGRHSAIYDTVTRACTGYGASVFGSKSSGTQDPLYRRYSLGYVGGVNRKRDEAGTGRAQPSSYRKVDPHPRAFFK